MNPHEADRDAVPLYIKKGEQHTSPAVPNSGNSTGTAGTADDPTHKKLFPMAGTGEGEKTPFYGVGKIVLFPRPGTAENRGTAASHPCPKTLLMLCPAGLDLLIPNQMVWVSHMGESMRRRPFVPLLCHTLGTTLTARSGKMHYLSTTYDKERLIMPEKPKNSLQLLA